MDEANDKKIIISADDFGISRNATARILELVKDGKIDRVAVMMSRNIATEDAKILLNSGVKIDIHFHLAKEKLDGWQTRKEEYVENNLKRILAFVFDYFFSQDKIKEAGDAWNSQLENFKIIFGRYPDGVGSHEHIHFFPAYFKIIADIASRNNIEFIRFGKSNYYKLNPVSLILNFLRFFNLSYFRKFESKIKTTDFFVSFDWINDRKNPLGLLPTEKKIELVFHPERPDEFIFLKKL